MRVGFNRSYNSSRLLFQQKVWRLLFLTSSCYIHFFSWRQSQQQAKSPNDFTTTTLYLTVAPSLLRVALFANICYIIQTSLLFADLLRGGSAVVFFFFVFLMSKDSEREDSGIEVWQGAWLSRKPADFQGFLERSGKYWCFCRLVSRVVNQINTAFLSCN